MSSITPNAADLLSTLSRKVRCLTDKQVARTWYGGTKHPLRNAARMLRVLHKDGLIETRATTAHPEIDLLAPLVSYSPGAPTPDFGSIAWHLKTRWNLPPESTNLAVATKRATQMFGGVGEGTFQVRIQETTHEIHFAQVYLRTLNERPHLARGWKPETTNHRTGKRADATIPGFGVIEIGGSSYDKYKLEAFHDQEKEAYYEIW